MEKREGEKVKEDENIRIGEKCVCEGEVRRQMKLRRRSW